ncbi:MAG TPA: toll/interleukin-1 receptor domain-containing protein [Burkholderiaceae bacterium]|nr:toll/interleukin-1 receptor domain-containing protein [Burkholderiaceae bacterium]HMY98860.1 toll/interleukin-1 receptor domain-containing protein [Burkholderiaceae bacterium]HNB44856.1 toll/interleukin-1 receptor domain-containing protein [Burkholderiaceae bacterium]HNG79301.1 toll/interleukin-1 receptor domain-containing protein [Burkholderiaceae bacterium]
MRIFISHGTDRGDAAEQAFLDRFAQTLKDSETDQLPVEILLDKKRLEQGYEWEDSIREWLRICDVAIILLTPRAVTRPWVEKEATILFERHLTDQKLRVIPIDLTGAKELPDRFGDLSRLQGGKYPCDSFESALTLAQKIGIELQQQAQWQSVADDDLQDYLYTTMKMSAERDTLLRRFRRLLNVRPASWRAGADFESLELRELARSLVTAIVPRRCSITDAMADLRASGVDVTTRIELFKRLQALWVGSDVYEKIPREVRGTGCEDVPVIFALQWDGDPEKRHWGPDQTLRRSVLPSISVRFIEVASGALDAGVDELERDVLLGYQEQVLKKSRPDGVQGRLRSHGSAGSPADRLSRERAPVFILLPTGFVDVQAVRELCAKYPSLYVLIRRSDSPPVKEHKCVVLLAGLDSDREKEAFFECQDVYWELNDERDQVS